MLHERQLAELADDCLALAREAAGVALEGYGARVRTVEKSPHDLVTEYDLRSQNLIVESLARRHPSAVVIGEEGDLAHLRAGRGLSFAVDPIDGTTNFAHGHPFWCVSIAALWDGEPVAGGIAAPALSLVWRGYLSEDVRLVEKNGARCRVSPTERVADALIATGFPPQREIAPDNNFDSFMTVKRRSLAVRRCGAAAIDLAFVADGTYDAYWERRLKLWDAAAGVVLVRAGGGVVSALDGGDVVLERGHIVASNGRVHDELVSLLTGPAAGGDAAPAPATR